MFGIDWNAPLPLNDEIAELVDVPATHNPLSQSDYTQLCRDVNPGSYPDGDYGVTEYEDTLMFVQNRL